MSVQSEINRISGNVTAALAAIAEKGVSVPSGSKSDALAELIAAIEAGGGGGGEQSIDGKRFITGTITAAADASELLIMEAEEAASIPFSAAIRIYWRVGHPLTQGASFAMLAVSPLHKGTPHYVNASGTATRAAQMVTMDTKFSDGCMYLFSYTGTVGYFRAGATYRWMIIED